MADAELVLVEGLCPTHIAYLVHRLASSTLLIAPIGPPDSSRAPRRARMRHTSVTGKPLKIEPKPALRRDHPFAVEKSGGRPMRPAGDDNKNEYGETVRIVWPLSGHQQSSAAAEEMTT